MTKAAQERAYRVQLYALAEEHKVCGIADEEFTRRAREIWENCFGTVPQNHDRVLAAIAKAKGQS